MRSVVGAVWVVVPSLVMRSQSQTSTRSGSCPLSTTRLKVSFHCGLRVFFFVSVLCFWLPSETTQYGSDSPFLCYEEDIRR
jgi:hypothetical protein